MADLTKDLYSLNANPMFNVGMGLLSSRYDPSINPFNAAMIGLGTSQAAARQQTEQEEQEKERQRLARMRAMVGNIISGTSVGHPGAQFTPLQRDMAQAYSAAAQYGDPMQALTGYSRFLDDAGVPGMGGGGDMPKNIMEWMYYNQMSEADQKRYLEMKRGQDIQSIAGNLFRMHGALDPTDLLSTLAQEGAAKLFLKGQEGLGTHYAKSFDTLKKDATNRRENYAEALRLREMVKKGQLKTGLYTGALYKVLPTADQEALDSLSLMVARQKLTVLEPGGRYTDADVKTLRDAMFGSFRTEDFNEQSLDRLIREIEALEHEYTYYGNVLGQPTQYNLPKMQMPVPGTQPRAPGVLQPPPPPAPPAGGAVPHPPKTVDELLDIY